MAGSPSKASLARQRVPACSLATCCWSASTIPSCSSCLPASPPHPRRADQRLAVGASVLRGGQPSRFVNQAMPNGEASRVENHAPAPARPAEDLGAATHTVFMGSSLVSSSARTPICRAGANTASGEIAGACRDFSIGANGGRRALARPVATAIQSASPNGCGSPTDGKVRRAMRAPNKICQPLHLPLDQRPAVTARHQCFAATCAA